MKENVKTIFGIFAIIGIISVFVGISNVINKSNNKTNVCAECESETEKLKTTIENLKEDIFSLEHENEILKEELNLCSDDSEAYKNYDWPKLTDGTNN